MDDDTADCPLSTVAAAATSVSYDQLSTLLKILPQKPDADRKTLLLHYALQTRHTFARLLATVRWLSHRRRILDAADRAEDAAVQSSVLFEDIADALFDAHAALADRSAPRPAVAEAVDLLHASPLPPPALAPGANPLRPHAAALALAARKDDRTMKRNMLASEVSEVTQQLPSSSPRQPPMSSAPSAAHPPLPPPLPPPHGTAAAAAAVALPLPPSSQPGSSSLGSVAPAVTERLAIATRNCIRESLLHIGPLRVLAWRSGLSDVCVRVGLPALWAADVSLDSLDPETPALRVHSLSLQLAAHADAPDPGLVVTPTPVQHASLRRMADDRMAAALHAARAVSGLPIRPGKNTPSSTVSSAPNSTQQTSAVTREPTGSTTTPEAGSTSPTLNPVCIMLCALHDMMLHDVCAPVAMSVLRAQARALVAAQWSPFIKIEGAERDAPRTAPLVIRYWLEHREPALIRITEFRSADAAATEVSAKVEDLTENGLEHRPLSFAVVHEPPLPTMADVRGTLPSYEMATDSLNLEHLLISSIRRRAYVRLVSLAETFRARHQALRLHQSCISLSAYSPNSPAEAPSPESLTIPPEQYLHIRFSANDPVGMEVRVFPMSGGVRVRAYGAAAISLAIRRPRVGAELWSGSKHFPSNSEETETVVSVFESVRSRVKLNAAARSLSALDIGVSSTLPPGTASVAATASPEKAASQLVPPFAPLERKAPRRFLTLSPPPPAKDSLASLHGGGLGSKVRQSGSRGFDRQGPSKRPRLTYATTSDALVFIQESSFAGEDWHVGPRTVDRNVSQVMNPSQSSETDCIDRYSCTAAAAAAWAVTRDIVERRLRRDSLLRAFVQTGVASAAQMHHMRTSEGGDLHLDSASRVLLKVKCEPLPVRRAELLLRGYDAWQVRLSLLPSIFDSTDSFHSGRLGKRRRDKGGGNLWSVGVSCTGSQLTFTYPSANTDTVRSFFRDLTRARTAAALARGVPPSRFYRVLRRSPVRIVVGIGPFNKDGQNGAGIANGVNGVNPYVTPKPLYTATVEYVYSKGNSGGFSLSFSPSKQTMEQLVPLIEEALDASGGQVGGILAGLLERACPVAAAAESALRERGSGKIRFVTALRVRAVFVGVQKTAVRGGEQAGNIAGQSKPNVQTEQVLHAVDVDARGGSGLVTVIDVGRATAVMIQQGLAHASSSSGGGGSNRRNDYASVPRWDEIVATLPREGHAEAQRAGSTVVLRMEMLEKFLSDLVTSAGQADAS